MNHGITQELFFGFGSGRVGTMAVANALNAESDTLALHEGKVRLLEQSGEQYLSFLTLQNRLAYENHDAAFSIIEKERSPLILDNVGKEHLFFGDIAYNYSPFVSALHRLYPKAKLIYFFRDCMGFVRSCTNTTSVDETPVGWPPEDKPLSKVERYISLGRWQPREGSLEAADWQNWDYIQKNIWLWKETNRVILEQLASVDAEVFHFKLEDFAVDPVGYYRQLRAFLGFENELPSEVQRLLLRKINHRKKPQVPPITDWSAEQIEFYHRISAPIRQQLGYI